MLGYQRVAQVALSGTSFGFDKLYSYLCVDENTENLIGRRVLVPFGRGNKKRVGLILGVDDAQDISRLKAIDRIIDIEPLIDSEAIELIFWLKDNTFCTYFDAYKTVVPTGLSVNIKTKYLIPEILPEEELSETEQVFFDELKNISSNKQLNEMLDIDNKPSIKKMVKSLIDKGFLQEDNQISRRVGDETVRMVRLCEDYQDSPQINKLTQKQSSAVEMLEECMVASLKELTYLLGITKTVISSLERYGIVELYEVETMRSPLTENVESQSISEVKLTKKQLEIFNGIIDITRQEKPSGVLLRGVTGSGKTSIFIKLIEETLNIGKNAMMLIPEIALTPQMVLKFQKLFGKTVAVINSSLSLGQRVDEYKRIKSGEARIVIGTRSAIFSPMKNIGIIIMDEEGERTYKSEASPRYHARDVAILRCGTHNATLLMASATPSIESYYFAKKNRYSLFELDERYKNAPLPQVMIVDMQLEESTGGSLFSRTLVEEIISRLDKKEQVILLLNRRGFHTYISCVDCKTPVNCPQCDIPMTFHKPNGMVMCHYCGYAKKYINTCESCGSNRIRPSGVGTQRAEDELQNLFPNARVLRMDADTTFSKLSYEKNFEAFRRGEYDIMIGTQMIAKGLDFPNVTLVGVLSLDKSLYSGDFRSYERTFSLITQVVGRSGRGDKKGSALIQTFTPEHYVLNLAAEQDYVGFYEEEIAIRRSLIYPPFCDTCMIGFISPSESLAKSASDEFLKILKQSVIDDKLCVPLRALGPAKCIHEKINNKYRYRLILKCKNCVALREFIRNNLIKFSKIKQFDKVTVFADINGDLGI